MKRFIIPIFILLALPLVTQAETYVPAPQEFESAIILQPKSRNVIFAYEPEKPHVAASLTKLLTGIATLELRPAWSKIVSIEAQDEVGGGRLQVPVGAELSVQDLFYSAIMASANNAAMALSRVSGVSREAFIARMNDIAGRIGAKNTHVYEASGMEVKNVTTAYDIARIAEVAFNNDMMRRASTISRYEFPIRNSDTVKVIGSTNAPFLADDDVWLTGGKTGYLHESKYNLVARLQPYENGVHDPKHEVIVVVLGAPTKNDSFNSVKKLAQWAWARPELFTEPLEPEKLLSRQLTYGMTANDVKTLQSWLAMDKEVYPEAITSGFFGPLTLRAVQRFQIKYGVVDSPSDIGYGVVGPATRSRLHQFFLDNQLEIKAQNVEEAIQETKEEVAQNGIQQQLLYGERNEEVRLLQSWLAKDESVYPEAIVSGFFGPLTLQAVQRFQLKHGVVSRPGDLGYGVVGPATRAKLHELHI